MAYSSFHEILHECGASGSIASAALAREMLETDASIESIRATMAGQLEVMRESVAQGLTGNVRSRSGLVGGDAKLVAEATSRASGNVLGRAIARAIAVGEVNAAMGRIVAAPTGGASGVLPGVLLTLAEEHCVPDHDLVDALVTASAIGGVIAARATLSGAAGGCQAEIGSAAAMAAAAGTEMLGGTPEQAGHAASLALQGLLGLVCDPIGGLVEVPCVARNATGTAVALSAIEMALAGVEFLVPFDEVATAAAHIGRALPPSLRETALGGLAVTPAGRQLAKDATP